ncbi:MAG: shikimate dehydrogenase [Leptospiraceae bacterium]|nr:shikimate dehydrogenase [Leptospiraceae bacterium]
MLTINRDTKFFGILGYPLGHTLSPLVHNFLFEEYKQNAIYIVLEKEHPDKFTLFKDRGLIRMSGLSVTIPHKEWAFDISDECGDETSRIMGAANTLVLKEDGQIFSYNTDGLGALKAILENKKNIFSNKFDILILGSGGSAKGIAFELLRSEFQGNLTIVARNKEKGNEFVSTLNKLFPDRAEFIPLSELEKDTARYGVIINTTPVGMKGFEAKPILTEEHLTKKQIIFDIVYNPIQTPLVEAAQKVGAKVIPGYEMFLYQAMEQFKLFTGIVVSPKNIGVVRKLLEETLQK